jgi:hypothetical protein
MTGVIGMLLGIMVTAQLVSPSSPTIPGTTPSLSYQQLVNRYLHGDFDAVVAEVAPQQASAFEQPFLDAVTNAEYKIRAETEQFIRSGRVFPNPLYRAQDNLVRLLLATILIQAEAALISPVELANDHVRLGLKAFGMLDAAEKIIGSHPPAKEDGCMTTDDVDVVRHDWVVLVALTFHARGLVGGLDEYIAEGLARYPNDPALELCLGVYYELRALIQAIDVSMMREKHDSNDTAVWWHSMQSALAAYEQVEKANDLAPEGHLRIGYVRAALGDGRRARAALQPLTETTVAAPFRYLALMKLGELEEADHRDEPAENLYRAALTLYPTAQAPLLALSRASDEAGDRAGARAWLERSFDLSGTDRVDPWWRYYGPFIDVPSLTNSLRQKVRE